jgi:hypothetical protein
VSVDYEYRDYTKMRLRSGDEFVDGYDFSAENEVIRSSFRQVHSVRAGTEWRTGNWYFRMGWGVVPDAYIKEDPRHGRSQKTYAGGIGYRTDHWGVDLGVNYVQRTTNYFPYDPALAEIVTEQRTNLRSLVTVSLRP